MYKSKLQELCQRRSWELPEYNIVKVGPDHMPRFTASVNVHGQIFQTPAQCKSAKDAQNTAAKIGFDHYNVPQLLRPQHPPPAASASPAVSSQFQAAQLPTVPSLPPPQEMRPVAVAPPIAPQPEIRSVAAAPPVVPPPEMQGVVGVPPMLPLSPIPSSLPTPPPERMYKSKLQELCQRRSWELPEYNIVKDGPDHMPRFTASVNVHGQIFQTPAQCKSAKDAQNTVAKIAFDHYNVPELLRPQHPPPAASASPAVSSQFQAAQLPTVPSLPPPQEMRPLAAVPPVALLPEIRSVDPVVPPPEMQGVAGVHLMLPLSPLPSSLPTPPPGLLVIRNDGNNRPADGEVVQQNHEDSTQTSSVYRIAIGLHETNYKDTLHMYKNQLQQYAQKQNLGFPMYTCEAEGPPHARRFRSRVSLDGKSYETLEFFSTLKEAEQAAAKVACQVLSVDVIQEQDGGLYKNLLQEFSQKKGLLCPSYETVSSGLSHRPVFVSTVEIGSDTFHGTEAKTKKQAEMNAAKVAYYSLTRSCAATESTKVSLVSGYAIAQNPTQNIEPTATTKKHQDTAEEEVEIHAKRAKCSPENVNVNAHLPGSSHGNSPADDSSMRSYQVENPTSAALVTGQAIENQSSFQTKTVVMPHNSRMPMPDRASVMPYSDEQWVAYKVELRQEPAA